jgi:hypothetical protein
MIPKLTMMGVVAALGGMVIGGASFESADDDRRYGRSRWSTPGSRTRS